MYTKKIDIFSLIVTCLLITDIHIYTYTYMLNISSYIHHIFIILYVEIYCLDVLHAYCTQILRILLVSRKWIHLL